MATDSVPDVVKRPAIYARVSTDEQAQAGTSLETQINSLRAELRGGGLPEPLLFVDDGYSGASPHRPGLMALEQAIADGQVTEVHVAALDRLARDLVLQETLLSRWNRAGVGFRSKREPDLGQADATRVLIRQVLGAISQYERAVITARMAQGRLARALQGYWAGGKAPDGYRLEGDPPKLVPDPERSSLIHQIGLRVIEGERPAHIANDLNTRRVPGPGGKTWEQGYVARMLRNPVYRGEARYRVREYVEPRTRRTADHALRQTKNGTRLRPPDEWVITEVPAIFTDTEWEAIQTQLGRKATPSRKPAGYLLSRRFHAPCGATYHGNWQSGKPRYLCYHRRNRERLQLADCGCPQIPAETAETAVWTAVTEILLEPDRLVTLAQEELRRRGLATSEAKLRKQLEALDRRLSRARDAYGRLVRYHAQENTLGDATFETAAAPLRDQITQLERERDEITISLPDAGTLQGDCRALEHFATTVADRLETMTFEERVNLLALLDVQVSLERDGRLTASLTAPESTEQSDQWKVLNCTSLQSRPEAYLAEPTRYELEIRDGTGASIMVEPSLPKPSWSRRFRTCARCGETSRAHHGKGLCVTCAMRRSARERREPARE